MVWKRWSGQLVRGGLGHAVMSTVWRGSGVEATPSEMEASGIWTHRLHCTSTPLYQYVTLRVINSDAIS